jgi:hypothetical protein
MGNNIIVAKVTSEVNDYGIQASLMKSVLTINC